jgi:hypothetical protein
MDAALAEVERYGGSVIGFAFQFSISPSLAPARDLERHQAGLGEFLTELRPVVALFVRFGGIDSAHAEASKRDGAQAGLLGDASNPQGLSRLDS